jgi:VirE-like protein
MVPHVSYYSSVRRPDSQQTISLPDLIVGIRSGRWKVPVLRARNEYQANGKSDAYKRFKEALPGFTPNGTFSHRNNSSLIESSRSVHADVDGLSPDRLLHVYDLLIADPLLLYAFISPSNAGIKFGYKAPLIADDAEYKRRFYVLEKHILAVYGLELDPACKDISRMCYLSYDPGAYFNPGCDVFHDMAEPPAPAPRVERCAQATSEEFYEPADCDRFDSDGAHPALEHAIRELQSAPLGTRNRTRIRMGRLVGGLIAGGQIGSWAAHVIAEVAAQYSEHPEQARKDIAKGIAYGQQSPIYPEYKETTIRKDPQRPRTLRPRPTTLRPYILQPRRLTRG